MPRRAARLPALAFLIAWSPAALGVEVGAGGGEASVPLRNWSAPPFFAPGAAGAERADDGASSPVPEAVVTSPLVFVGISPCRVTDTREPPPGTFMLPGVIRDFAIAGQCSIPQDADAVSFNFTVTETGGPGFLLVYPAGGPTPLVSTLNFLADQTVANAAVVPLGVSQVPGLGKGISVIPGVSGFHLVIDVNGYYAPQGSLVTSLNGLSGAVSVTPGANVTVTPAGQNLQISAGPLVSSLEGLAGAVDVAVQNGVTVSAGGGTLTLGTNGTANASASTLVARDGAAGFAAGTIELSGSPALLTAGGGTRLLHRTGSPTNVFLGASAGGTGTSGSGNSAVGSGALAASTSGADNSAFGADALAANTTGGYNTAAGKSALAANTIGTHNAAFGWYALAANLDGSSNSAFGATALDSNTSGSGNSAFGYGALSANTSGSSNAAFGVNALFSTTTGTSNTAMGSHALSANVNGGSNAAFGTDALSTATGSSSNSAFGMQALRLSTGNLNSAFGSASLDAATTGTRNAAFGSNALGEVTTGQNNVGVGDNAGIGLTTGSNNVYVGQGVTAGGTAESNTIRIGNGSTAAYVKGIFGATAAGGSAVFVDSLGKLGTVTSSARFKEQIADLPDPSGLLLSLRPVSFVYREDERRTPQAGLIAEEVDAVAPHLVVRDGNGDVVSVRYDQLVPLLLAEAQRLERENASLRKAVEALAGRVTALEGASGAPSAPAR